MCHLFITFVFKVLARGKLKEYKQIAKNSDDPFFALQNWGPQLKDIDWTSNT